MAAWCDLPDPRHSHSPQPGPHEIESSGENAAPGSFSYLESSRKIHQWKGTLSGTHTGKKRGSSVSPVLRNGERAEIKPDSIEHLVQIKSELDASGPPYFW